MATVSAKIPKVSGTPFPERSVYNDAGAVSMVIGTGPAVMVQLIVTNLTATAGFVQLFDAASLPADTTVPLVSLPIPASGAIGLDTPVGGLNGLVVAISTTADTLTISANNARFFANLQEG